MISIVVGGSVHEFEAPITGEKLAREKSTSAIALVVEGELRDLSTLLETSARVDFVKRSSPEALSLLRHDCAHVMAQAVQELWPEVRITFGPVTEEGFYYDFSWQDTLSTEHFEAIEKRMHEIVERDDPLVREVWERSEAVRYFKDHGEEFKAEWVEGLPEEPITIYRQGSWLDLCRGPHLPSTGHVGHAFKLLKLSGAYWRGDKNRPQLQRIYGTCWRTPKELNVYLKRQEELEKRDHRKIGRHLDLFHFSEEALGSVFWHPKGWIIFQVIEGYIRGRLKEAGYQEVKTPQLLDRALWERSGHWSKFREHMFLSYVEQHEPQPRTLALKPMNCPCHVEIFKQSIMSYRDLPLRLAEFGSCHRFEPHGALHGLMRVRAMTQDDAHIFCTEDQIVHETVAFCRLLKSVYRDFGFHEVSVKFSDRPSNRAGDDATWDVAEEALREAVAAVGLAYTLNPGEGAFYGPKLEFVLKDALGREWQCGTLQVDLILPARLGATYITSSGEKAHPVILHRAVLGTFERFIGILIEQYEGKLPLWLAPVQVVVAPITEANVSYGQRIVHACEEAGLRVSLDARNEKIAYKIREHSLQKVPFIFACGRREEEQNTVSVRCLGQKDQDILDLEEAVTKVSMEARAKTKEVMQA